MSRPNILLILTDQFRYDCLSCLGHPVVQTPNLDAFAADALQLTSAYAATMACGPSRASLFTGLHSDRHGQINNQWTLDPPDIVGFPQLLRDSGYDTALVGKLHLKPMDRDYGFTHNLRHDSCQANYDSEEPAKSAYVQWLAETAYKDDPQLPIRLATEDEDCLLTDEVRFALGSNWIVDEQHHETVWTARQTAKFIQQDRDKPFFAQCSFFGPHQPFACPGKWGSMYDPDKIPLPEQFDAPVDDKPLLRNSVLMDFIERRKAAGWTEATYRKLLAAYYGNISMIDHYLGEVFDALKASGQWDNTLIIFTADHGDYAGQFRHIYKGLGYEGSSHIPMIVRDPRSPRRGEREDAPVSLMDVFATCLAAGEVAAPPDRDSRDLSALLRGDTTDWDDTAWFKAKQYSMLVEGRYKLLRGPTPGSNAADGKTAYEFYDLKDEPREWVNRIDEPRFAEIVASMRERLDAFHTRQERYGAGRG